MSYIGPLGRKILNKRQGVLEEEQARRDGFEESKSGDSFETFSAKKAIQIRRHFRQVEQMLLMCPTRRIAFLRGEIATLPRYKNYNL